jgi:hypothetical protein
MGGGILHMYCTIMSFIAMALIWLVRELSEAKTGSSNTRQWANLEVERKKNN